MNESMILTILALLIKTSTISCYISAMKKDYITIWYGIGGFEKDELYKAILEGKSNMVLPGV